MVQSGRFCRSKRRPVGKSHGRTVAPAINRIFPAGHRIKNRLFQSSPSNSIRNHGSAV